MYRLVPNAFISMVISHLDESQEYTRRHAFDLEDISEDHIVVYIYCNDKEVKAVVNKLELSGVNGFSEVDVVVGKRKDVCTKLLKITECESEKPEDNHPNRYMLKCLLENNLNLH